MTIQDAINIADLRRLAEQRIAGPAFDYYRSGAGDELTLGDNALAWQRIKLRYRVLVDVSQRSMTTSALGSPIQSPIIVAPTAFHKLADPSGEIAMAEAAGEAGTVMILSTLSTTAVEEVVAAAVGPVWFQLYIYRDRGATRALVERAIDAGCKALVLTVDAPLLGTRERDVRNAFTLPDGMQVQNMLPAGRADLPAGAMESGLSNYFASLIDPALTMKDVEWLASISALDVIVKGIVRGDDAASALDAGARAVVVSNHGGRQLDTSVATADALAEVADAMQGRGELYVDGGIRRGTDILKALALGARAVLVGRPMLWGLAAGGKAGALKALQILERELDIAMALAGCADLTAITPDLLSRR